MRGKRNRKSFTTPTRPQLRLRRPDCLQIRRSSRKIGRITLQLGGAGGPCQPLAAQSCESAQLQYHGRDAALGWMATAPSLEPPASPALPHGHDAWGGWSGTSRRWWTGTASKLRPGDRGHPRRGWCPVGTPAVPARGATHGTWASRGRRAPDQTGEDRGIGFAVAEARAAEARRADLVAGTRKAWPRRQAGAGVQLFGVPSHTRRHDVADTARAADAGRRRSPRLGGLGITWWSNAGGTVGRANPPAQRRRLHSEFALNAGHAANSSGPTPAHLRRAGGGAVVIIS